MPDGHFLAKVFFSKGSRVVEWLVWMGDGERWGWVGMGGDGMGKGRMGGWADV